MTKVIILGEVAPKEPKKPIEFKLIVMSNGTIDKALLKPNSFDFIELIATSKSYDIFYAYNKNNRSEGAIFLGHFNDGVV